jgi:murein tripeptide amidase MpaA
MRYDSTQYQDYETLTALLTFWAESFPALCSLRSIARSPEGREVWAVVLTNAATGPDTAKPAYLIDGNHHAGEITSCAAAVYTIWHLLEQYGQDPAVTELLDTRAVYVVPRLAVDGSEAYLKTPQLMRSRVRLWPEAEQAPGLVPADVDGDGRILRMRIPDPNGSWRVGEKDPRLLVRRRPSDREGTFYRVFTEGIVRELTPGGVAPSYSGRELREVGTGWGLDFNRNYPVNWAPEHRQPGAGPFPFSEPEIRGLGEFVLAHPNIGGWMSWHTFGGVNLRPSALVRDEKMNQADLAAYRALGAVGKKLTGYPDRNLFEIYTVDPDRPTVGSTMEFGYEYCGIMLFGMELWDREGRAGIPSWGKKTVKELLNLSEAEEEERELKLLEWNDRELGGAGFAEWRPFLHPQLGQVEIGGWDFKYAVQNPPPGPLLEEECHRHCLFVIEHALALPLLRFGRVELKPVGGHCWEVAVQVRNTGYLPTQVMQTAVKMKRSRGVEVALEGPVAVIGARGGTQAGPGRWNVGEIEGRGTGASGLWQARPPATDRWMVWVVQGEEGAGLTVTASHPRAGKVSVELNLGAG